jgi:probable phosphoglycerate mutase
LTELGRRQAACLAERLQHELAGRTCLHYCSELKRAAQTAQIIAQATGVEPITELGLKEYNNGLAAGRSWGEAERIMRPMREPRVDWRPYPQAETQREFYLRVAEGMERLTRDPAPLLLVTHGGTITNIVAWWLGLQLDQMSRVSFPVAPASLSVLRINHWNEHVLERLNDTAHLHVQGLSQDIFAEE